MYKGTTPLLNEKPKKVKKEWLDYIHLDLNILNKAIYLMYEIEKFTKFTNASEALKEYKKTVSYRQFFPKLTNDIDKYLRKSYKGGFTYVSERIKEKEINSLIDIYDINSMYPSIMLNKSLPFGYPNFYTGNPTKNGFDEKQSFYIARVMLKAELKKGYLPTFQTKDTITALELGVSKTEYIKTTNGYYYEFTFTNHDIDLIKKHYDCDIIYKDYYEFKTSKNLFRDYIKKYRHLKENAKNKPEKEKAKIMLNSLYGKFGSKTESISKVPKLVDGVLKFNTGDFEEVEPNYIAVASAITSLARHFIISNAQQNYDNFLYADTDSLHLLHSDELHLDIHPTEFGKWAFEGRADKAKYLRAKLYMEHLIIDSNGNTCNILDVKGAGMTKEIKKQVTFDNFKIGQEFNGKKATKQVKGGMVIVETTFKIKDHTRF